MRENTNTVWSPHGGAAFVFSGGRMLKLSYLAVVASLAVAGNAAAAERMDATMRAVAAFPSLAHKLVPRPAQSSTLMQAQGVPENSVRALMRFHGDALAGVRALGVHVGSIVSNIATIDIPASMIDRVAAVPGVIYIEAAKRLPVQLDKSVPATHANTLRTGTGLNLTGATGKGVIVGIVDDGIDFRHMDFRNADGSTRILQLWDMRSAGAAGSPPTGFSYGGVCTADMINQVLSGQNPNGCTEKSDGGHGTHVAGIAAGNGQATGNGMDAFRMVGMAPQADIVAANPLGKGVSPTTDAVIDGVNYVKQVAKALGKPAVVNLSLGSNYGSRDGTSNYETALSAMVDKGFLITGAAGNDGDAAVRATGSISQGQTVKLSYSVTDASKDYEAEMWYPGTQAFTVRVTGPAGSGTDCDSAPVSAAAKTVDIETSCGNIVVSSTDTQANNDDRQIFISLAPGNSKVATGTWTISLTAASLGGASSTTFSMIGGQNGEGGTFLDHTDLEATGKTSQIVIDTASATNVIAVGAYVSKTAWFAPTRRSFTGENNEGDIAKFSAIGPRRNCSNLSKCPPVMKPEIVAPGTAIVSALSYDYSGDKTGLVDNDGVHIVKPGTSMASPHVTGAIALLLQKNPNLGLADVRQALFGHTQETWLSPAYPVYNPQVAVPSSTDFTWGYGALDAAAAYQSVTAASATVTAPSFTLHRSAASGMVSYTATITPVTADLNKPTNVYIGAQAGASLFLRDGAGNWQSYSATDIPVAANSTAQTTFDVPVVTLPDAVNTQLIGTTVYVGYGSSVNDMLNGKVGVAGTIQ
jgi:subtilisin family serine protease